MSFVAKRISNIHESVIRGLTVYANSQGAINLGQGSPDFGPPKELLEAAVEALQSGYNQYVPTWGLPELREAISKKTERFYGFLPNPDTEVTVTCGVTEAVISALLAVIGAGDNVLVLEPAHENYYAGIIFAGANAVWLPLKPPNFELDADELRKAFVEKDLKAIIFNTPHNPSGRVFSLEELQLIADLCIEFDVIAISDEIYEHMVFDDLKHIPIATLDGMADRTITISGLSKTYSVTGWRIGYAIAQPELTTALRKVHDFTTICAPSPLQKAAVTAINFKQEYYDWLEHHYLERRERVIPMLNSLGFKAPSPSGAYYTMANFTQIADTLGLSYSDNDFSYWLIEHLGIGTIPAGSFYKSDPNLGLGHVRFAFPKKDQTLDQVEERFEKLRKMMNI